MTKKVKKLKLNIKAFIILLLILYLIGMLLYTFFTMPIKNIYIKNTNLLTDNEIIEIAGIKKYPSIFKIHKNNLETKIAQLDLVKDVSVEKKLNGKLIITIDEARALFYNQSTEQVVLSNGKSVSNKDIYLGIPTLINFVPNDLLTNFINALTKIEPSIISMINEIEYSPDISEDITIDDQRFKLYMNDGNIVYINILNIDRLNNYIEIYASISSTADGVKGTLYLDSYLSENNLFTPFNS